jgi:hypothetical protein
VTFTATTALPHPHLERATAGLRDELRHQLLAAGVTEAPDWTSMTVRGPEEFQDGKGRTWFGYWVCIDVPEPTGFMATGRQQSVAAD